MKDSALRVLAVASMMVTALVASTAVTQAQGAQCDQTYVVKLGDWLSKIAQQFYGSALAYQQIYDATNAAAKNDTSFATLTDPSRIEPGQKLCIPKVASGQIGIASFDGVSFSFDTSLAPSAQGEHVAAVPVSEGPALGGGSPAHIRFTFPGYPVTDFFDPRLPAVRVYETDALNQLDPSVAKDVSRLKDILASRPATITTDIPVFPQLGATQVFHVQDQYLDFKNGSGVGFVTYYAQDVSPVTNDRVFYTFQGLTNDGKYYVTANWFVGTPALPKDVTATPAANDYDAWAKNYDNYLKTTTATLDNLSAVDWTPNLALLDNLVKSIEVNK